MIHYQELVYRNSEDMFSRFCMYSDIDAASTDFLREDEAQTFVKNELTPFYFSFRCRLAY